MAPALSALFFKREDERIYALCGSLSLVALLNLIFLCQIDRSFRRQGWVSRRCRALWRDRFIFPFLPSPGARSCGDWGDACHRGGHGDVAVGGWSRLAAGIVVFICVSPTWRDPRWRYGWDLVLRCFSFPVLAESTVFADNLLTSKSGTRAARLPKEFRGMARLHAPSGDGHLLSNT